MGELIPVDPESLRRVEAFLRRELREPVDLGRVWLAAGALGKGLARIAGASAITFGPVVSLSSSAAARLGEGLSRPEGLRPGEALDGLGSLLVHECTHVWQYKRHRAAPFLATYLFFYYTSIYSSRAFSAEGRRAAYRAIPYEREAHALAELWEREQLRP